MTRGGRESFLCGMDGRAEKEEKGKSGRDGKAWRVGVRGGRVEVGRDSYNGEEEGRVRMVGGEKLKVGKWSSLEEEKEGEEWTQLGGDESSGTTGREVILWEYWKRRGGFGFDISIITILRWENTRERKENRRDRS